MVTIVSAPHGDSSLVFRSVVTGKPWDQFESWQDPSSSSHASSSTTQPTSTASVYLIRACSSTPNANVSHEDHIKMGWGHSIKSPYISFSTNLEWAIYYQLKHEHVKKVDPHRRQLYALEVVSNDIETVAHTLQDPRAKSYAYSASERLGTLQVRVVRYLPLKDQFPPALHKASIAWFQGQKTKVSKSGGKAKVSKSGGKAKYPFSEWRRAMRSSCQLELDTITRAVADWFLSHTPTRVPFSTVVDLSQVHLDENTPLLHAGARVPSIDNQKQPSKPPPMHGNAGSSGSYPAARHPHAPLQPMWQVRMVDAMSFGCQCAWTVPKWVVMAVFGTIGVVLYCVFRVFACLLGCV